MLTWHSNCGGDSYHSASESFGRHLKLIETIFKDEFSSTLVLVDGIFISATLVFIRAYVTKSQRFNTMENVDNCKENFKS